MVPARLTERERRRTRLFTTSGVIIGSFTPAMEEALLGSTGSLLIPAFVVIGISLLLIPMIAVFPRYVRRAQTEDAQTAVA